MQTYGIFGVTFKTGSIKTDIEAGRVLDAKFKFSHGVIRERKFTLEHMPVLNGSTRDGDKLTLEVVPMLDGTPLPAVDLPVALRGNISIDIAKEEVLLTLRICFTDLDEWGLGIDALLNAACCLECTVSNQSTLDEQIRTELKAEGQAKEDVADVLKDTKALLEVPPTNIVLDAPADNSPAAVLARCSFGQLSSLLQAIGRSPADWADPARTDDEDAAEWRTVLLQEWDALLATDVLTQMGLVEAAPEPEEDMPFRTDGGDDFGLRPTA